MAIKSWSEQDRPREKCLNQGVKSLSDSEILAIILGSGSRSESAVDLARRILRDVDHGLSKLISKDIGHYKQYKGVGDAKAVTLIAALELAHRIQSSSPAADVQITSSKTAYDILRPHMSGLVHEEFWIILLSRNHKVLVKRKISHGGTAATVVDNKIVLKAAFDHLASAIIVAHNHPSGTLKPSQQDIQLTSKLKAACGAMDINLLDHLILTNKGYYSFKDEGIL